MSLSFGKSDWASAVFLSTAAMTGAVLALCGPKPNIFANGGDRVEDNIPEVELCKKLKIKMVFNVGGKKIQSSTNLLSRRK